MLSTFEILILGSLPAERLIMRHDGRDEFQALLWGQILLFALIGASFAFFVAYRSLPTHWALPELRLVLQTTVTLAAAIIALLAGVRFSVEGRRLDLLLSTGFLVASVATFAYSIAPVLGGAPLQRAESWAGVIGRLLAWTLIAAAPFARGRSRARERALGNAIVATCFVLLAAWSLLHAFGSALPELDPQDSSSPPVLLTATLATQALLHLAAIIGFALRFRSRSEDLDRWLALGATLMLFASLYYVFTPLLGSDYVSLGDALRVLAYGV